MTANFKNVKYLDWHFTTYRHAQKNSLNTYIAAKEYEMKKSTFMREDLIYIYV